MSNVHAPTPTPAASPSRATYRRRRVLVVAVLVVVVFAVGVLLGRVTAQAGPEDAVGGQVVVEPGQTLWDIAVDTAPDGMDPRQQLADVRELNGLDSTGLEAWSVVLLPAR